MAKATQNILLSPSGNFWATYRPKMPYGIYGGEWVNGHLILIIRKLACYNYSYALIFTLMIIYTLLISINHCIIRSLFNFVTFSQCHYISCIHSYIIITLDIVSDLLLTRLGICYYKNIAEIRIKFWEKDIINI